MESCILIKKGSSLLEVTVVIFIIGVIIAMVMPDYLSRIKRANYQKTVHELTAIAQASIDYYMSEGSWPTEISQLAPQFIPRAIIFSPFGTNYQINCVNNMVSVSVLIPAGIANRNPEGELLVINDQGAMDQVVISQVVNNNLTSRLSYQLKNGY